MSIIAVNEPSIFIPHVFSNTSDSVEGVFVALFGRSSIDRVDIVRHSEDVCRAYVHFTSWPNTAQGRKLREKLLSGETVKVVYSEPRFWKCVASKINKPQPREEAVGFFRGPYIEVDDMMVKCVSKDEPRNRGSGHRRDYDNTRQSHYSDNRPPVPMRRVPFHSGGGYQEQSVSRVQEHSHVAPRRHQIKPAKNFKNKQWIRKENDDETKCDKESDKLDGNVDGECDGDEASNAE